jgi:C-terminal processing protease CtpA/Prc
VGLVIASTKPKVVSPLVSGKKLSDADGGFKGVTVMDSFEGYAFDGGLRVGDRLVAIGGVDVRDMGVERVRDYLRGDPDSDVLVRFERDGYGSPRPLLKEAVLTRRLVRISDVRLATFLGAADAGIG